MAALLSLKKGNNRRWQESTKVGGILPSPLWTVLISLFKQPKSGYFTRMHTKAKPNKLLRLPRQTLAGQLLPMTFHRQHRTTPFRRTNGRNCHIYDRCCCTRKTKLLLREIVFFFLIKSVDFKFTGSVFSSDAITGIHCTLSRHQISNYDVDDDDDRNMMLR